MKRTISLVLVLTLGLIASVANADFTFGDVEALPESINTPGIGAADFTMTADGLEAYFVSTNRPGGYGGEDIWVCRRQSTDDSWGPAVNLGPPVNTWACDSQPCISADGLELYFGDVSTSGSSKRPGGHGSGDIWVAKRKTRDDNWGGPVNLGSKVNSPSMEVYPNISADGLSLYFTSKGDLHVATRPTKDANWASPVRVAGAVNSSSWEGFPSISADQRVLFFYSNRSGGYGGMDIYMSMRPTVSDVWEPAVNLGPKINSPYFDIAPSISSDGCTLHFAQNTTSNWGSVFKTYRMTIDPVVDLDGDGIVDATDMCIMVDNWGTDNSLCDIGPMPWGDGVVDVQDLIVLAEHLFADYRLIAHWKLDETEGDVAYDSVGTNDAVVTGGAVWQPGGGQIRGALAFDGIDDYLTTDFVLNPIDGAFSVFAWIKGGAPGQVILSQADTTTQRGAKPGSTWLGIDPSEGKFMASLTHAVLSLKSDVVITDDQWHEIGLVYDGSSKYLYVDGAEAAKDDLRPLSGNDAGLHIGAGNDLRPGSLFSGLIDDVRIYDRAVTP